MKKRIIFPSILFAAFFLSPGIYAQKTLKEKNKTKAANELEMVQEAMEKQKQAFMIQKDEMAKRSQELSKEYKKASKLYQFSGPEANFFYGRTPAAPGGNYTYYPSDKNTTLTLHKKFNGESDVTKNATFIVNEDATRVRFNINGTCLKGSIQIIILLPSGKKFNVIEIDPAADITWSQSLKIEEGDKKYTGEWHIAIKATKVLGSYSFSISAI